MLRMDRLFLFGYVSQEGEGNSLPSWRVNCAGRMRVTNDSGLVVLCSVLLFIVFIFQRLRPVWQSSSPTLIGMLTAKPYVVIYFEFITEIKMGNQTSNKTMFFSLPLMSVILGAWKKTLIAGAGFRGLNDTNTDSDNLVCGGYGYSVLCG